MHDNTVRRTESASGGNAAGSSDLDLSGKRSPKLYVVGLITVVVVAGTMAYFSMRKHDDIVSDAAVRAADAAAGPYVLTTVTTKTSPERKVVELGEMRPYASTTLYAKITGYLGEINVDKGDHVKKGQLLARIFAPETTQDYAAAQADSRNKHTIADRYKDLQKRKLVSDQEAEQAFSDADVSKARLEAAGALKGYEEVRAPFDGTVSARYADPGALLQANTLPIVNISQTEKLRVTIYLDQRDASYVKIGDPAEITLNERPGVLYKAKVTRMSGELDTRTRTQLTEIELDNKNGEIVAGSFVNVALKVKAPQFVQMSIDGLVMRGADAFAAIVTKDHTLHYQPITLGENAGETVEVLQGLEGGETVAQSVGNNLAEGQHVQVSGGEAKK